MNIPAYNAPSKGEIPGVPDSAGWIYQLFAPRDRQIRELTAALISRLDFSSNMNAEVRRLHVFHDTEVEIKLQKLKEVPIGVVLLWNENFDYSHLAWDVVDAETIKVKVKFDASPTTEVEIRILIIGGGSDA